MERTRGSLEIITQSGTNPGIVAPRLDLAAVPAILAGLYGITVTGTVDAPEGVNGRVPLAEWTGTDADGFAVTIKLWPEPVLDLEALAAALAAEQQGGV